jgi:uncharacterized protein
MQGVGLKLTLPPTLPYSGYEKNKKHRHKGNIMGTPRQCPCHSPNTNCPLPLTDDTLGRIQNIARTYFQNAKGSHDWEHTQRVVELCNRMGPGEGADMVVLKSAAYLHDIGRAVQDESNGSVCHAVQGAEMARRILALMPLEPFQKENIVHCVRAHRYRDGCAPKTIEAKVLFDADKLDGIGAVGVARAYLFAGEVGARLHTPDLQPSETQPYSRDDTGYREFVVKLSNVKDRILTAEGRRLAEGRHAFMVAFFERFLDEYAGKC